VPTSHFDKVALGWHQKVCLGWIDIVGLHFLNDDELLDPVKLELEHGIELFLKDTRID